MTIYYFYNQQIAKILIFEVSEIIFASDFYVGVRANEEFINLKQGKSFLVI